MSFFKKNYTPVWYAFYDLQTGNTAGAIFTTPEPTKGMADERLAVN